MNVVDTQDAMQRLIAFVNTRDVEAQTDALVTRADLATWLQEHGLLAGDESVSAADVDAALRLREALRTALLAHDEPVPAADGDAALATIPLRLAILADGAIVLMADGDVTPGVARLVAPIPAAIADGTWARIKVCPDEACLWAFYDQSRNRSRRWCSMEVCGNREKTRTFRQRQRRD